MEDALDVFQEGVLTEVLELVVEGAIFQEGVVLLVGDVGVRSRREEMAFLLESAPRLSFLVTEGTSFGSVGVIFLVGRRTTGIIVSGIVSVAGYHRREIGQE